MTDMTNDPYLESHARAVGLYEGLINNLRLDTETLAQRKKRNKGRPTVDETKWVAKRTAENAAAIAQLEYKRMESMHIIGIPINAIAAMVGKSVADVEQGIRLAQYYAIPDDLRDEAEELNCALS